MKKVIAPQAGIDDYGHVVCPNCDIQQGESDEFNAGLYECESCWNHYTVSNDTLKQHTRDTHMSHFLERIESLSKRLVRVEKELGIK